MSYQPYMTVEYKLSRKMCVNGECRDSLYSTDKSGYPRIEINGKKIGTHRLVWELAHGLIPDGLHVLHHCDNPRCIRTSHLFLGTNNDNVQDKVRKNRQSHLDGERHPHAKLSHEKAARIRTQWVTGCFTRHQLADEYGVSPGLIGHVVKGRNWKT